MDRKTLQQYQQRIWEAVGVDGEYDYSGLTQDLGIQGYVMEGLLDLCHKFKLKEEPEEYPGFHSCFVIEEGGRPSWLLLLDEQANQGKILPYETHED